MNADYAKRWVIIACRFTACDAMAKRFFYEYIKRDINKVETIEHYLDLTDDEFIATLVKQCTKKDPKLAELAYPFAYKGRKLYKPAYILYAGPESDHKHTDIENFFAKIIQKPFYHHLIDASTKVARHLKKYIPGIEPLDIIVESTPVRTSHEEWDIKSIKIWDIRKNIIGNYPARLDDLDAFLRYNARAYLFCSPKYYKRLQELTKTPQFSDMLAKCT